MTGREWLLRLILTLAGISGVVVLFTLWCAFVPWVGQKFFQTLISPSQLPFLLFVTVGLSLGFAGLGIGTFLFLSRERRRRF